jgi:uncharacterized protein (UPF0332 family)
VSPRSQEYLNRARARLALAEAGAASDPGGAVAAAYYAAFFAANAALSEQDLHARTHRGTWHLVNDHLVVTGRLDSALVTAAAALQPKREAADYAAWAASAEEAVAAIDVARRFVDAVATLG